jgi:hypothetical protein
MVPTYKLFPELQFFTFCCDNARGAGDIQAGLADRISTRDKWADSFIQSIRKTFLTFPYNLWRPSRICWGSLTFYADLGSFVRTSKRPLVSPMSNICHTQPNTGLVRDAQQTKQPVHPPPPKAPQTLILFRIYPGANKFFGRKCFRQGTQLLTEADKYAEKSHSRTNLPVRRANRSRRTDFIMNLNQIHNSD